MRDYLSNMPMLVPR